MNGSDEIDRLATPTLVTRCYVPHIPNNIEILRIKSHEVMKITKMFTCEWESLKKFILETAWVH